MHIHLQIGNMQLMSAYTPAHTIKRTLCYQSHINNDFLIQALSGRPRKAATWDMAIPTDDENFCLNLQRQVEEGLKIELIGRPFKKDGKFFYPARAH